MPGTMRAVDVKDGAGPLSSLFINDQIPLPEPKESEVLIKVKAFGINRADLLQREGKYPVPPGASKIMGLEFSGVIHSLPNPFTPHDPSHTWQVGDEVFGLAYGGTYAEYVTIDARMLIRKPTTWPHTRAAGVCETWMTALQALHLVGRYSPSTHRSILWHAGASSVSIAGIQLCRAVKSYWSTLPASEAYPHPKAEEGAIGSINLHSQGGAGPLIFATARKAEKCKMVKEELGADGVVNASSEEHAQDWEKEILKLNGGQGIDLIVDYVGASYFAQNLAVLARDGRVVQLAALGGTKIPAETDIGAILMKRIRFEGSTLRSRAPEYQQILRDLFERVVLDRMSSGEFDARIERVYKLEEIAEAQGALERNETSGKVVVTIE